MNLCKPDIPLVIVSSLPINLHCLSSGSPIKSKIPHSISVLFNSIIFNKI
ncbi:hypothetical protein [Candidatus Nitrosocosmicus hydrocola]|nr:hypothetical protein [Candidatus Nitrosocosmicus hydrocola]